MDAGDGECCVADFGQLGHLESAFLESGDAWRLHQRGSVRAFAIKPKRHHKPQSQICKKRTRDASRLKTQRRPLEPVGKFWLCAYLDQTLRSFVHKGEYSYGNL